MDWNKEKIAEGIATNDRILERAILAIFRRQTNDEQICEEAKHRNKMGFNGCDAQFGSSLAKRLLKGCKLSDKQINAARKMMKKYAGQLEVIAKERVGV